MKAVVYHGTKKVSVEEVSDPQILDPKDCIIKITRTALCGSDLHLYNGYNPAMEDGDIMGHEFMGIVEEVGSEVKKIKVGDRVIIPFAVAEGGCWHCQNKMFSLCQKTNPDNDKLIKLFGYPAAALYGYSHVYGGIAGGQAQYVRVLHADANAFIPPEELTDEEVLFTTDIFPTGFMAADNAGIKEGDTVVVWGSGPVGLFSMKSAFLLGAARVIVVDRFDYRLEVAKQEGAETINYEDTEDVVQTVKDMTNGDGPNAVIDAVGMESHSPGFEGAYDKAKQTLMLQTDRPSALREVIQAARPGTTVSVPGVYMGYVDKFPFGIAFGKGLTFKMGQTHVHKYVEKLFGYIKERKIDPTFLISHRLPLDEAPHAYEIFSNKEDNCVKVVFDPWV